MTDRFYWESDMHPLEESFLQARADLHKAKEALLKDDAAYRKDALERAVEKAEYLFQAASDAWAKARAGDA